MTAVEAIRLVYAYDGKLTIEGDVLKVSAPAPLPDDLRQALREHKPAILVALGAPLDTVIHGIVADIRPLLSTPLRELSDDKLMTLVNWSIMAAWGKSLRGLEDNYIGPASDQAKMHHFCENGHPPFS